jgi:hypothetical protein
VELAETFVGVGGGVGREAYSLMFLTGGNGIQTSMMDTQ